MIYIDGAGLRRATRNRWNEPQVAPTNLGIGSSNLSGRAKEIKDLKENRCFVKIAFREIGHMLGTDLAEACLEI